MNSKILPIALNCLVVLGLNPRTIFSRLGLFKTSKHKPLKKEVNRDINGVKNANDFYSLIPKEIEKVTNKTAQILNKKVQVNLLLEKKFDKRDYLRVYTLHYLGFSESSDTPKQLIERILDSDISNQPFVESLQIFNCLMDKRLDSIVGEQTIIDKYNSLINQIEYQVDGNHVLENIISLILTEIKFLESNPPSIKILVQELERQTKNEFHWEKNLKYCKDLCLKLEILCCLLNHFDLKSTDLYYLEEKLNKWRNKLFQFSNNIILHDNIDGDKLKETIMQYQKMSGINKVSLTKQILIKIPSKGVRGHAFDGKISLPFNKEFNPFGTLTYSVGKKRNYQRLRYNNCQTYFDKSDTSHFFFLSFRSVLLMPYIIFNSKSTRIYELITTKKRIKLMSYQITQFLDRVEISSKHKININFFVDNKYLTSQNILKTISQNKSSVSKSIRAVGIDKYKRTYRLTLKGTKISLYF